MYKILNQNVDPDDNLDNLNIYNSSFSDLFNIRKINTYYATLISNMLNFNV